MTPFDWVRSRAEIYHVPAYVLDGSDDTEDLYRRVRALCAGCYSERMGEGRTADRRAARSDYSAPGQNFLLGATDDERRADTTARLAASRAALDVNSARGRLDQYTWWTRYKYLLAILTGRYGPGPSPGRGGGYPGCDVHSDDVDYAFTAFNRCLETTVDVATP